MWKGWEIWDCSAWEEKALTELIYVYKILRGGCKRDQARLFSVVPTNRTRGIGHKLKYRVFCLNIPKHFFYYEVDGAVAQAAQSGCGISLLGGIQMPEQLAMSSTAWAGRLDQGSSRGCFKSQPFCDWFSSDRYRGLNWPSKVPSFLLDPY